MNRLPIGRLTEGDISVPSSVSGKSFVVRAEDLALQHSQPDKILEFFGANADLIKQQVKERGVLLFRGLPINDPLHYQGILEALKYDLYSSYHGGVSPRSNVTGKTFVSTEAPAPFIIPLHTEYSYQNTRPGMISFFCMTPAAGFGETPLFDLNAMWNELRQSLRERLEANGLLYKRVFFGKKSVFNFRKTWRDTFYTQDKKEIEKYLEAEGMQFQWDKNDNLATELRLPAVLHDPLTGIPCISITTFNADTFIYLFRHFKERYSPVTRLALEWFARHEYSGDNIFLRVLHGCRSELSHAESYEIQRAAWANAIVFPWKKSDLLLIDNIRFGHARLNVRKPRRLIAAMADRFDVRKMSTPAAKRPAPDVNLIEA